MRLAFNIWVYDTGSQVLAISGIIRGLFLHLWYVASLNPVVIVEAPVRAFLSWPNSDLGQMPYR